MTTDSASLTREELLTENAGLRAELEKARQMAEDATEYRVLVPENSGATILIRRKVHGADWAASIMAYGGGRAWTTEGWQRDISALSVDRLFCWPDPLTARAEICRALADL